MEKTLYTKAYKRLIEKLRTARIEAGLTQEDVSAKLKVTQSYVSKAENGHSRIDIIQLKEFADLYKKKITHFLD